MLIGQVVTLLWVLNIFATTVYGQYFDFLQGFQALLQPYPATNYQYYDQTTKKSVNRFNTNRKSNYDDSIVFLNDYTTKKPKTTTSTTTIRPRKTTRNPNRDSTYSKSSQFAYGGQQNIEITTNSPYVKDNSVYNRTDNNVKEREIIDPSAIIFPDDNKRLQSYLSGTSYRKETVSNQKLINNNFEKPQKVIHTNFESNKNQKQPVNNYNKNTVVNNNYDNLSTQKYNKPDNSYTTQRTTTKYYENRNQNYNFNSHTTTNSPVYNSNNFYTTQIPAVYNKNPGYNNKNPVLNNKQQSFTTKNPLLHQPGVKPANVNENSPPITNRPVTDTSNNFPGTDWTLEDGPPIEIGPNEEDMSPAERRRYLQLAEEVCEEYRALTVKEVRALPLAPSSDGLTVNVSDCTPTNIPLIIGGRIARIEEFPHMALVGWLKLQGGYSWKCGGSLISDQYILTAGHCTFQEKDNTVVSGPPHAVQLGSAIMDDPTATVVTVAAVYRHPKYKRSRVYHDVAMIKLVKTVVFSDMIRPACLGRPPVEEESIIATGWGRTEFGGDQSQELRSVSLPIWNIDECRSVWGTTRKLPNGPTSDDQVCAGEKAGGKDTCQGDSGGPAQTQDGCIWRVVAVTSYGRSCGAPQTPALYAKIPIPFVIAKVFGDRARNPYGTQTNNKNQNRFQGNQKTNTATEGYIGYENRKTYTQTNYGSGQQTTSEYQQNYGSKQRGNSGSYENTPKYDTNQQNQNRKQTNYDTPQENYSKDRNNYGNNQQDYSTNQQNSGSKQQSFGNTQQNYNNRPQNYDDQGSYGTNQQDYSQNQQTFGSTQQSFNKNEQNYGINRQNINRSLQSYDTLGSFGTNQQDYSQNQQIFGSTQQSSNKNEQNYGINRQNINRSPQSYDTPGSFGTNQQDYSKNHQNIRPTQQNYNRNEDYYAAVQDYTKTETNSDENQNYDRYQSNYETTSTYYDNNRPNYGNSQSNYQSGNYDRPNYEVREPNYRRPEVTRPWWSY